MNPTVGVNVEIDPTVETVPETTLAPCFKVIEAEVMVNGSMGTLKVTVIALFNDTFSALFNGSVDRTVGANTSPVLKDQVESFVNGIPKEFLTPVVTVN